MKDIHVALRSISALTEQLEALQILHENEEQTDRQLLIQTFQAVTALNIHMLNQNMLLMDALKMYDTEPEEEDDEEEAEEQARRERNRRFLARD